jgi:hypothetical protein
MFLFQPSPLDWPDILLCSPTSLLFGMSDYQLIYLFILPTNFFYGMGWVDIFLYFPPTFVFFFTMGGFLFTMIVG